jgi:hypothetical protein
MRASRPSWVINDGEYGRGKRIQVINEGQGDDMPTVLEGLQFFLSVQQPGDRVMLECRDIFTKRGELAACQVSFTRNPDDARPS